MASQDHRLPSFSEGCFLALGASADYLKSWECLEDSQAETEDREEFSKSTRRGGLSGGAPFLHSYLLGLDLVHALLLLSTHRPLTTTVSSLGWELFLYPQAPISLCLGAEWGSSCHGGT